MKMKAITTFREHIKLPKVSDVREKYVRGEIFQVGSMACAIESNKVVMIKERKSNYVVDNEGEKYFLSALIPIQG